MCAVNTRYILYIRRSGRSIFGFVYDRPEFTILLDFFVPSCFLKETNYLVLLYKTLEFFINIIGLISPSDEDIR